MTKINYREGDWFAVPLRNGGYGVGVIARANPKGVLLGFFFGPKRPTPPAVDGLAELTPDSAVHVRHFGHLGLVDGRWLNLGPSDGWDRSGWVASEFGRREPLSGRCLKEIYDDDDPNLHVRTVSASADEVDRLPRDGLSGAGALEVVLTKLLG